MSELFLNILNMSISASWIVLAVIVLRLLLKKAPKRMTVLLWGIVGLRLIFPFSLESVLSLIPSGQTVPTNIATSPAPSINSGVPIINDTINPIITHNFTPTMENSVNPLQSIISVISVVWLVGITAMLIYTVISYIRVQKQVNTAVLLRNNIYQSETVGSPYVLGIIKPKIYLPFKISGQEMEYVIAHEQSHIDRKDHFWKPLGFLILTVYWFNPLLWLGYILLCRDIELACDEKVINRLDADGRADYSEALLNCSVNRRLISACPLAFGEVGVKLRIKRVLSYKKPAFCIVVVAVVAIIATSVCLLTNPKISNKNDSISEPFKKILDDQYNTYGESYYYLTDMDGDKTAELITLRNNAITAYSLKKNKAVKIFDYDFVTATFKLLEFQKKNRYGLVAVTTGGGQNYYLHIAIKDGQLNQEKMFDDDFSGINNYKMTKYIDDEEFINDAKNAFKNEERIEFLSYDNRHKDVNNDNSMLSIIAGTNDLSQIEGFEILHKYGGISTDITDNNDLAFLKEYTYSHEYPMKELHKLFSFPETQMIKVISGGNHQTMYLMKNGDIAIQAINSNSYDVYTADSKYLLDEKALINLLKKYGGYK